MKMTLGGNDNWLSENVTDRFQNILSTSSINQLGSKRADWDVTDTGMPWSNDDPWQVVTVEWWNRSVNIKLLLTDMDMKSLVCGCVFTKPTTCPKRELRLQYSWDSGTGPVRCSIIIIITKFV